ncbi:DUF512 domain-containing protein [Halanaerobacter jeridensis]|uniref:Radical SAM enzyme (TIGR03279 family) n=1 Tax=Halanaerobacter jeridensis TaxID=706427 RepID=A0A939BNS9_9FIRM|nr:DUF512 domain-containing protein [Halanaerobacter jeridensis]MBM7556012.1 putative radical SAM enzyme (TIGR03279 family) [Halanaerobacter jeridensis]
MEQEEINSYIEIEGIKENSIADEIDLEAGDKLVKIDGQVLSDYIDYKFLVTDNYLELEVVKESGEYWVIEVEKGFDEELGIEFSDIVFDGLKTCHNNCIFCFVDQMPDECRNTLSIKDDDYRFSFLKGSYTTLTNLSSEEFNRIKRMHLSPINISVHSTNAEVRKQMLNNKNAGKILEQVEELVTAGIEVNTQVVLCPGVNDGQYLRKTIEDLGEFAPQVRSLAIVPVGLTKYREGLADLRSFTAEEAKEVITMVEEYQTQFQDEFGSSFVYLADEFYLLAGEEIPKEERYDDFPQLENGVGMVRLLRNEFEELKENLPEEIETERKITLLTGELGFESLKPIINQLNKIDNLELEALVMENDFFGSQVTVTGLLTGQDILKQLQETESDLGDLMLVPDILLNDDNLFLDDLSWEQFKEKIDQKVIKVDTTAQDLVEIVLESRRG